MHYDFSGRCARLAFTQATAASCVVGAPTVFASRAYSREIDRHARSKTRRTASAGVGIVGFFMGRFLGSSAAVSHGSIFVAAH